MGHHSIIVNDIEVGITNPDKLLWPSITKAEYLTYLSNIAPFMLPCLHNKPLTVIRFPDGIGGEAFYQRNCPEYAPDYISTVQYDDHNQIICSDLQTLLWLGNQAAIEFHVPFSTYDTKKPSEIVFDLDPPSKEDFHLAIKAAQQIKTILDQLHLIGFIKLSGNKGIQIHIPLPHKTFSYNQTKQFTRFIANYLTEKDPDSFTTERLKEKRNGRLYIDYVQHAAGKTIIAPYSARGNKEGLIAAPIKWQELTSTLTPRDYTMKNIRNRKDHPFTLINEVRNEQPFKPILDWLSKNKTE
ncbi:non-homologous end-joining DNA ligase [Guptibacillus hwajinpoensis]|uniref:Bifunctional non-homologous end joining protein LigD n=1 Tax=Guptibacillus hwajinpoensis TaxID=208199 RepID=A0ABU0K2D1_9BACL|nr:non-homologous end-joining DNA ligase [Alkalihalobacillus hemicentroti]MDQ0483471.1 bifunctional non-homologous end joining protein LigD [Alkalihalobacillus hemicentroti]